MTCLIAGIPSAVELDPPNGNLQGSVAVAPLQASRQSNDAEDAGSQDDRHGWTP